MTREPHAKQPQDNKGRRPGAARQAQWQFQADLLEQLGDAVIAVDQDDCITYLNRAAVAQYGVDPTSAIGQPLHQIYRNEWLQPEDELLADATLAQQGHWRGENRHLRQDGRALHVESIVTVLHDAAGNPVGLLATIRDITDRKQIERDLRANELRYRRLADTMPQLIWTADASGRTDYYNIHIHDFDPSVWQGTNGFDWASLLHPADLAPTLAAWQQAVTHRQPYTCEHRMHMADGSWRWHLSRAALLQDPDQGLKWYGTATDIHERKVAEATLRTSEERYRTLFETMDEGFCVFEMLYNEAGAPVDYRFLEVNPAFAHFTGLENAVGKTAYELVPNLEPHWVAIYGEVARTGEARHFIEGSAAMGRWFEVHAFRFGGPESRRVALLFNNITERKLIEDALRDSEEDLRYTVELNPQVPWTADPAGNITSFNQRWLDLTGMCEEEALGSGWVQTPHPADRPAMVAAWSHTIQSGEPYDIEHRIRLADGSYRWMRSRAFPRRDANGAIVRWYGATEDIHERKQMEEALHASEARFRAVQQASPDGYMIFECVRNEQGVIIDFRWLYINPASEQMIGRRAQDLLGKRLLEEMPGNREEGLFDAYVQVVETGEVYQREFCYQHEGIDRWFRNTAAKAGDGFAVAFSDITARKQAEADQQLLADLAEQIRLADEPEELISAAVRLVGDHLRVGRCLWIEIYAAEQRGFIHAQHCRDLPPVPETYANADYSPITRAELTAGRLLVNHDAQQDPRTAAFYATTYAPYQERAYIGVPFLQEGRWRGLLSVTTPEARQWQVREIHLLETVAERVWLAVEKLRLHAILRANEARLRQALVAANAGGWFYDLVEDAAHWSPEMFDLYGLPPARSAPTLTALAALIHPDDRAQSTADMAAAAQRGGHFAVEFRIVRADGQERWMNRSGVVELDVAGQPVAASGIDQDITVRKQAEIALQQSNAILQGVLECSNDAIFVRDLTGRYLLVNEAGAAQVRLPKNTILGRRYQEIFTTAEAAAIQEEERAVLGQGRAVTLEHVVTQQGNLRYWHTLKMPLRDANGAIIGLISSARDLTERKAAEEALRLSEARYRTIFENAGVSLWEEDFSLVKQAVDAMVADWRKAGITDPGAAMRDHCAAHPAFVRAMLERVRILNVNEETVRLYGRPKTELLRPFAQHFTDETLTHFVNQLVLIARHGQRYTFDGPIETPQGETRHVAFTLVFPTETESDFTRVLLSGLDITTLKEAEMALRSSEARFRHLAEAMPQIVWTCQADGSMTYINQQWQQYSGISTATTLAEGMWPAIHPDDQAANRDLWQRALDNGAAYEGEVRLRRQDGLYRWFLERAIPVCDEAGVITQWFGVSIDIDDRKVAEQRQAELVALLEAMLENAPVGLAFLDRTQRFVRINQMLADQHGRSIADHIGRTFVEIAPQRAKNSGPILEQVFTTGEGIYNHEISGPGIANPKEVIHTLASWFPVVVHGHTRYVGSMIVDITERKRQERHQQFLNDLGMDLRLLNDTETILTQLVKRLGDYLQVAGCRVNGVDLVRGQFTLQKDWAAPDAPWPATTTPGVYPLADLAAPLLLTALQAGQTVVVANTLRDPRTAPVAANYEQDQVQSLIGVPIFHQGHWRATLSVKGYGERQWRADEVALLESVAGQLSALLEKVRAEEALRASEERLRLALAGGGMGIWESQVATNRSLWSPEEYALFGLPMGVEITSELFDRLVHPADLPGLQVAMQRLFSSGKEHAGEFRIIRPDGAVRWLADRVTVLRDEVGQPVRLLGINFDITERKAREAMIRQQLAEIEAIYATAPIGLCLVDCELRYVRINETLATINGGAIAGYLGRTLAETMSVEGYRLVEPLYRQVIETGLPLLHQEVDESYVDPAQARDWLANYYPLKNAEGVVIGVNAVILEITERKRHERQLQELNRQLQESNATLEERVRERTKALEEANRALSTSNRELEQFTYAAAHDLRTPLRGIANLVQWISEDAAPVLPPASQRHLGQLGGRVKRLEKMLEDLLLYSRVGRVRYQPEAVDVQQLLCGLLDLLAPPVGFVIKLSPQLPTFTTLRIPLEMVFRNLLSNAIRHHHDPARGQVEITVRDLGEWYEFRVSDNGPGIALQYHDRIFGMFQTLKPRDQVEGSGIGLALVKKTLEKIGGRIWVESVIGQGTTFYFTWPKEQKAAERREEARRAERGKGAWGEGEPRV